ncbi:MAG: ruvA [Candidatus Nomurabacteria bacterium]|nr:ruvA [Candidatus Nomurabacteria bacterium]
MIGHLRGKAISVNNQSLILDVGGVGYSVYLPLPLLLSVKENDEASFCIHTHVREDSIVLYGFKDTLDLALFENLINISGIGPKSALAMLSVHSPASIADAIEREDIEALSHTPGVGKKTAAKIILELKGKLAHLVQTKETDITFEVRMALETLGYSPKEIHDTLSKLKTENKTTGVLIKEALQQLQ